MKTFLPLFITPLIMAACSPDTEQAVTGNTQNQFAVISSLDDCIPYAPLIALRPRYNGIYMGEVHGSMNTPEIIECFILLNPTDKRHLIISLEMFHDTGTRQSPETIASGAKGLGTGTPPIRKLIAHYQSQTDKLQFHYHDGYYTNYEYGENIRPHKPVRIEEDRLNVEYFRESWTPISNARERSIGEAIRTQISEVSFIIALGGNIHASRATWQEDWGQEGRAGSYLPQSIATVKLLTSKSGQLRFCSDRPPSEGPACDLYDIKARTDIFPDDEALIDGSSQTYDYLFDVGAWRPIPPPETD